MIDATLATTTTTMGEISIGEMGDKFSCETVCGKRALEDVVN